MSKYIRFSVDGNSDAMNGILSGSKISQLDSPPFQGGTETGQNYTIEEVTLLSPVVPSKIICVGLNYKAHVEASHSADKAPDRPLIFFKPPSSIIGQGEKIVHPPESKRVDYEAELGLVIGTKTRSISEKDAKNSIFGYTCVNDVTARDLQKTDKQWARAKGFDTFCPVGPWIENDLKPDDILVEGIHNGEIRQSGRTSQMIFSIDRIISYISSVMTLYPGDIIATGTPSGIAPMESGDKIEVRIEGIGILENYMA